MSSVRDRGTAARRRRRIATEIKDSLRELSTELSLLNRQVVARIALKDGDLHCMELIARQGPLSPTALARRAGLHPATVTGILDRLESGGWVVRERDTADRRAVVVRVSRDRTRELISIFSGMNRSMDELCAGYTEEELRLVADFLKRTIEAGSHATDVLAGG